MAETDPFRLGFEAGFAVAKERAAKLLDEKAAARTGDIYAGAARKWADEIRCLRQGGSDGETA